jgi:iron complex transport system substrate-binding protein
MKMSKFIYPVLLISIMLLLSIACATPPTPTPAPAPVSPVTTPLPQEKPPVSKSITEEPVNFPITITDDLGRQIKLAKLPQKIISLAPSSTEMLFALGLDDKIVGVTDYCDFPEAAKTKPRVASYTTPNIEKLVSMAPDLVLAESIHEKTVLPALEKLGLTVFVSYPRSIGSILQDITLLGQANAKVKTASQLVSSLNSRINTVRSKTDILAAQKRLRVLYVVWHQPIWTMGSATFTDDLIKIAGGTNIYTADFTESRIVSLESVITKNPQVIIISGMGTTGDQIFNGIKQEDRLKTVDAMINNRVFKISNADLIERPGPRIVDGLEEIARLIHPELFGNTK